MMKFRWIFSVRLHVYQGQTVKGFYEWQDVPVVWFPLLLDWKMMTRWVYVWMDSKRMLLVCHSRETKSKYKTGTRNESCSQRVSDDQWCGTQFIQKNNYEQIINLFHCQRRKRWWQQIRSRYKLHWIQKLKGCWVCWSLIRRDTRTETRCVDSDPSLHASYTCTAFASSPVSSEPSEILHYLTRLPTCTFVTDWHELLVLSFYSLSYHTCYRIEKSFPTLHVSWE